MSGGKAPSQSEGDVNRSPRRAEWQREHLDEDTRALLAQTASMSSSAERFAAVAEALKNQPGAAQMGELASAAGFKKMVGQASFVLPEALEVGKDAIE